MTQLHKRFSDDQVLSFFQAYDQGLLHRQEVLDLLGISRSRFFELLNAYRADPSAIELVATVDQAGLIGLSRHIHQQAFVIPSSSREE